MRRLRKLRTFLRVLRVPLFIFTVIIMQCALQGCAFGRQTMVLHSLLFDTFNDNTGDIEVLDYQYGNCERMLCANKYRVAEGATFPSGGATGYYSIGEFLYVKWRIKETGQVCEDRVDLTKRLPADMNDRRIYFVVKGEQLYVYLFPPPGRGPSVALNRPVSESMSAWLRKHLIYPDHPKTDPYQIEK